MRKSGIFIIVPLLLAFFFMAGCSRSEIIETPVAKTVQRPAVQQRSPASNESGQYLRSCMKGRPEKDRKYCECFAAQMEKHLKSGSTSEEIGRASGIAALSCRNLK